MNAHLPLPCLRLAVYLLLSFAALSSSGQSTGPIAHWRFDEAPGATTAPDSAGTFNGTLSVAGADFITGGRAGNALVLNRAAGGLVSMGNALSFASGTNFTLAVWVRTTDTTVDSFFVGKRTTGPGTGYALNLSPSGVANSVGRVQFSANASAATAVVSSTVVNDGNWHQVVAVFSTGTGSKSIYVDGTPVEQSTLIQPPTTNTADFLIGGITTGGTPTAAFTGAIDDVQVYDRALSDPEINFLFNNPGFEITTTTLTGTVRNALNNQVLPNVAVRVNGGAPVTTDAQGQFTATNVLIGDAVVTAAVTGFINYSNTFTLVSGPANTIGFAMSPNIASGTTMRMVLNWGAAPRDLDSHLETPVIGGSTHHVYFANRGSLFFAPFASLDVDVTGGFGPETITVTNFSPGTYHYYVYNFSGSPALAGCGATAQLYTGAGLVAAVQVPDTGVGDYWYVARIDGATRLVTIINQITNNVPVVLGAPSFSTVPQNVATNAGATVLFSVTATGNAPLNYQWRFNGINIVGANSATLVLNNIQAANAGQYDCVVSNPVGSVTSPPATLTVNTLLPVIAVPPASFRVPPGTNVTFAVVATGPGPFTYQWRHNGGNLLGANASSLTLSNVQPGSAGNYTVVVVNAFGTTISSPGSLEVLTPPVIATHPLDLTVAAGESASFSVAVTGSAPFHYQWRLNGVPVPGATNSLLTLFNAQFPQEGTYSVSVSNDVSAVVSSNALLVVNSPPFLTAQPVARTVSAGRAVTFNAGVQGSPVLAYQWRFNGTNLPGATAASLSLAAAQVGDRGFYSLVITNAFGSVTSAPAFLAVHPVAVTVGWSGQAGGPGTDVGNACAADANGNFYVAGAFTGTATFGTNTLVSAGQTDVFIAKYNNAGALLWARRAGGPGFDAANGIASDGAGNTFVTGSFEGGADFGTNSLTAADADSFSDIFVARLDASGSFVWARGFGAGAVSDSGNAIAVDSAGNVLVAGSSALATFGASPVLGAGRILLAKLDASGNPLWARLAGVAGFNGVLDAGTGVGTDAAGNVYLAGNFEGPTATFGGGATVTLANRGVSDGFLAIHNSAGALQRVAQIGGSGSDRVNALVVDAAGNAHVGGQFSGTLALGATGALVPAAVANLTSSGQTDGFVAKFDATGGLLWGQSGGGASADAVRGLALGPNGTVHATGFFAGAAAFGSNTLASSGGTLDIFTARYTSAGLLTFAQPSGGDDLNGDYGNGIAVDPSGNSFVAGQFSGTTTLGPNQAASGGGGDVFVARFNAPQESPPQVAFRVSNSQLVLTWPVAAYGWGLQNAPTHPIPNGWLNAPHTITVVGDEYVVTIPLAGQKGFFRLIR
jgi:uncharacterized protein YfaP (DUF2135 family)